MKLRTRKLISLALAGALVCSATGPLVPARATTPQAPSGVLPGGIADLAVGMPGRDVGATLEGGALVVLRGVSGSGLSAGASQYITQLTTGTPEHPDSYDHFAKTLASGDFNGDHFADLAIGAPDDAVNGHASAGVVNIMYGSSHPYGSAGSQLWSHDLLSGQTPAANEFFGAALAVGDFNLDGFDDLAIGVPGQGLGTVAQVGMVNLLYGSAAGLTDEGYQVYAQGILLEEALEANDMFGQSLAAADFNGDGYHDLAIGTPQEDLGVVNAGVVQVLYGAAGGLSRDGDALFFQGDSGLQGAPELGDRFGDILAAGDFDGNGYDDLAIGVPYEDLGHTDDGVVHILWGTWSGLTTEVNQLWTQDLLAPHASENLDQFGYALAAGDFDHDGYVDLAISAPGESLLDGTTPVTEAGLVHVLYASGSGFTGARKAYFQEGDLKEKDHYGAALAAGDFSGDGYCDLAIGVPDEDIGADTDAGYVNVLYGSDHGVMAAFGQVWKFVDAYPDLTDDGDDAFGFSLAAITGAKTKLSRIYLPLASNY